MTQAPELYKTHKRELYKEDFSYCFRCGMCSNGCPVFDEFDYKPHEIPLTLGFGDTQKLIANEKI